MNSNIYFTKTRDFKEKKQSFGHLSKNFIVTHLRESVIEI